MAAGIILFAAGLLPGTGGEQDSAETTQPRQRGPQWAGEIPIRPAPSAGSGSGTLARGFLPMSGVLLDGSPLILDAAGPRLLAVSGDRTVKVITLEEPRGEEGASLTAARVSDLVVSNTGTLIVSDRANGQLWQYSLGGRFLGGLLSPVEREKAELSRPVGLATDTQGGLLVTDAGDHKVKVFSRAGEFRAAFGGQGFAPGQFSFPTDVAVSASGNIFVADSNNARIQVFDPAHEFVLAFPEPGGREILSLPRSLAFDGEGRLHVVDTFGERVAVFTAGGQLVSAYGRGEEDRERLNLPQGIVVAGNQYFVGDRGKSRIAIFGQ